MEIIKINSHFTAFFRTMEGVNAGLIHTSGGMILVDTTSSPAEARGLLDAVGASLDEVQMVINTHFHSDHTWGNQVFKCPILAQRLCSERMQREIQGEWSSQALSAYLLEIESTNPSKAAELSPVLQELHITLPNQVFDDHFDGELGGVKYEVIHLGGHTPDCSVVWLPETRLLYASDLVFQGRYPYIFDADIPAWIDRLGKLMEFGASTIVPGHGNLCGEAEIHTLIAYLQETWERTAEHVRCGIYLQGASNNIIGGMTTSARSSARGISRMSVPSTRMRPRCGSSWPTKSSARLRVSHYLYYLRASRTLSRATRSCVNGFASVSAGLALRSLAALALASIMLKLLNEVYFRPRPFTFDDSVRLLFYHPSDSSLPSNAATVCFALSIAVWLRQKRWGAVSSDNLPSTT